MPRLDLYHDTVKRALEKDGWRVTNDPFTIKFEGLRVFADLGAERIFAAEREGNKIVVEIKVMESVSLINEFERALGQYNLYRSLLKQTNPERKLYLAVTEKVYEDFFEQAAIRVVAADQNLMIIIFNPVTEKIVKWIN